MARSRDARAHGEATAARPACRLRGANASLGSCHLRPTGRAAHRACSLSIPPVGLSHGLRARTCQPLQINSARVTVISAAWLAASHSSVAGLPRANVGDHYGHARMAWPRVLLIGTLTSRDRCVAVSSVVEWGFGEYLRGRGSVAELDLRLTSGLSWESISQMKPASCRVITTQILFSGSFRAERYRWRSPRCSCACHAI